MTPPFHLEWQFFCSQCLVQGTSIIELHSRMKKYYMTTEFTHNKVNILRYHHHHHHYIIQCVASSS